MRGDPEQWDHASAALRTALHAPTFDNDAAHQLAAVTFPGAGRGIHNAAVAAIEAGDLSGAWVTSALWHTPLGEPETISEVLRQHRFPGRVNWSDLTPTLLELAFDGLTQRQLTDLTCELADPYVAHDRRCAYLRSTTNAGVLDRYIRTAAGVPSQQSMRSIAIRNPACPRELLVELADGPDTYERLNDIDDVLRNPAAPDDILTEAAVHPTLMTDSRRRILAANPACPTELLDQLAASSASVHNTLAADNPNATAEQLHRIARRYISNLGNLGPQLRGGGPLRAAIGHPNTPSRTLAAIHAAVTGHPAPEGQARQAVLHTNLLTRIAEHPNLPVDIIEQLATHPNSWVRYSVARNPSTPPDTLRQLHNDLLAHSSNTLDFYETIQDADEISAHPSVMLDQLLANPNTPTDILELYIGTPVHTCALVKNPTLELQVLEQLALHDNGDDLRDSESTEVALRRLLDADRDDAANLIAATTIHSDIVAAAAATHPTLIQPAARLPHLRNVVEHRLGGIPLARRIRRLRDLPSDIDVPYPQLRIADTPQQQIAATLDGTALRAGEHQWTLQVIRTPRALNANATHMRNCTEMFAERIAAGNSLILIAAAADPNIAVHNIELVRTDDQWTTGEINSRHNQGGPHIEPLTVAMTELGHPSRGTARHHLEPR